MNYMYHLTFEQLKTVYFAFLVIYLMLLYMLYKVYSKGIRYENLNEELCRKNTTLKDEFDMYKLTTDRQLSKIENLRSNCTLYRKLLLDRRLEKDKAIRILKVELDDAKENIRILENRLKQYRDVSS